jgi:hypothetical protein
MPLFNASPGRIINCLLLIAFAAQLACCKKNDTIPTGNPPKTDSNANGSLSANNIVCSIQGKLVDTFGLPVQYAMVKAGSGSGMSDINGYFRIVNTSINQNGGLITVNYPSPSFFAGEFTGSRNLFYRPNTINFVQLNQVRAQYIKGITSAAAGGTINLGPVNLTVNPNSIIKAADSTAISGSVLVYASYLDASQEGFLQSMPGNLFTVSGNNTVASVEPYGMVIFEMIDDPEDLMALAKGATATLQFPANTNQQSLTLYSFDSTAGFWKNEGTATRVGNVFSATIHHFSAWCIGNTVPAVDLTATFTDPTGHPLANRPVEITAQNHFFTSGYAITDSAGNYFGKVPTGQPLTLTIKDDCGGAIFSTSIGPLSSATGLGTRQATSNSSKWITITGTLVDCSGNPITSGYALVNLENNLYKADVDNSGNFSMQLYNCSDATVCSLTAFTTATAKASNPVPIQLNNPEINLGNITVCSTAVDPGASYFFLSVNGVNYDYITPSGVASGEFAANTSDPSAGGYFILGSQDLAFNPDYINMFFSGAGTTGNYPLSYINQHFGAALIDLQFAPYNNTQVTVSEFGGVNQFIAGSFSDSLNSVTQNKHVFVTAVFRVQRTQ